MKWSIGLLVTVFCIVVGIIPELAMWGIWSLVHPSTEVGRIVMVALFLFGGTSLSILFGIVAFVMWAKLINVVLDY
jgi:hypothetical protein